MSDPIARLNAALEGRYAIERELGEGGMATVYMADDLKHERKVALKVLKPELAAVVGMERFLKEIRTIAQLQHPHILPLYDSGEADGHPFYVMPLVEGESLGDRITRERTLPVEEATRLICEVADALSYAHGRAIVHRDIKPENILLANGHAFVADFGIAVAMRATSPEERNTIGETGGTAAYMSPEQAVGEATIDERSDIYSLAGVLYEMLTGDPPFDGKSPRAIIAKRFLKSVPSARVKRPRVSHRVDAAIRTAMALEPSDRFQSAARFADAEFFSDGITEDILNALARLPGLRVIGRTSSFVFKGKPIDVREVGKQLGVGTVLEGSVRKAGARVRITTQLVETEGGHQIWSDRFDREMEDVFAVQDEITESIRDALSKTLLGLGSTRAAAKPAIDPETYELFLRGRFFVAKRAEGMQRGMEYLAEVVARAPGYALAYAELATAYSILTHYCVMPPRIGWPKVRELAEAALRLDPTLARAHAELGSVALWFDWNWEEARERCERAVALDPNDPWVNVIFSTYLASLGLHDEAEEQCQRARAMDPLNPSLSAALATTLFLARRHNEVVKVCDRIIDQDPTFSDACRMKGAALRELGLLDEAIEPTRRAVEVSGGHPWMVSLDGMLQAMAGRGEEARAIADAMIEHHSTAAEPPFTPPLAISLIFCMLKDRDRFFGWLERAYQARDSWLIMLRADPTFDPISDDPRHDEYVARVGVPEWGEARKTHSPQ